jgi:hypothetical protein
MLTLHTLQQQPQEKGFLETYEPRGLAALSPPPGAPADDDDGSTQGFGSPTSK